MAFRNAIFNASGTIDCEFDHPVLGWVPFTASPDDPEQLGREMFEDAKVAAAPYVAPPEPTIEEIRASMPPISPRQLRLTLLSIGITDAEVETGLASDPAGLIEWRYATYFRRAHPLVDSLGIGFSITPEQIDSLWAYAQDL
ncbi:hypothetical protein NKJ26_03365 [Mesorhizobium sp. M0152]|uniref:hypothetical protein n=1 Tax=Mesorhizobium sp. M0152 TaxID=2956898 RepID=UPI00333613A8